jgi:hypothetical protein
MASAVYQSRIGVDSSFEFNQSFPGLRVYGNPLSAG